MRGCRKFMFVRLRAVWWWLMLPLLIIAYTAAWLVPATWWYQPGTIIIADTPGGSDPVVSADRQIRRSFDGLNAVSIWRVPPDGHVACAGSDTLRYKGGLYHPHTAPLTQWADDPWCARLDPGEYYAEACWTVLRPFGGLLPAKTTCINSPVFRVLAPDADA